MCCAQRPTSEYLGGASWRLLLQSRPFSVTCAVRATRVCLRMMLLCCSPLRMYWHVPRTNWGTPNLGFPNLGSSRLGNDSVEHTAQRARSITPTLRSSCYCSLYFAHHPTLTFCSVSACQCYSAPSATLVRVLAPSLPPARVLNAYIPCRISTHPSIHAAGGTVTSPGAAALYTAARACTGGGEIDDL